MRRFAARWLRRMAERLDPEEPRQWLMGAWHGYTPEALPSSPDRIGVDAPELPDALLPTDTPGIYL